MLLDWQSLNLVVGSMAVESSLYNEVEEHCRIEVAAC